MKKWKDAILRRFYDGLFPSIWLYPHPFRIAEYHAVLKGVHLRKTDQVLDIGCGSGIQTYCIGMRAGKTIGIDLVDTQHANSEQHRIGEKAQVEFLNSRLQDCGFAPGSFDKIFSFCVIEHIPEYDEIFRLCHQLLKPGGALHFSVDALASITDENLLAKHKADHQVVQYFTPEGIEASLRDAGFEKVQASYLFRSSMAKRLFEDGIRRKFSYRLLESWRWAIGLWLADGFTPKDEPGMFVVVRAWKRSGEG
jgi:2-polyprenyl-3-methyl-5-hydroxy-6-metoxy-1,4-benzoquinol methylase